MCRVGPAAAPSHLGRVGVLLRVGAEPCVSVPTVCRSVNPHKEFEEKKGFGCADEDVVRCSSFAAGDIF